MEDPGLDHGLKHSAVGDEEPPRMSDSLYISNVTRQKLWQAGTEETPV